MDGVETEPRGLNPTQRTTDRVREIVYPREEHTNWLSNTIVVYCLSEDQRAKQPHLSAIHARQW